MYINSSYSQNVCSVKFECCAGFADESRSILSNDAVRICADVLSSRQQDPARGSSIQTRYSEVTGGY